MTPRQAVDALVDYDAIDTARSSRSTSRASGIPGMDPFPPSRAEAVRIARERGEGLGEKVLPAGTPRRLQPVVDKFFYSLRRQQHRNAAARSLVGEPDARDAAAARGEADAVLARPLRDRRRTRCATTG